MDLSVVIPVYDECDTLRQVVDAVAAVPLSKEIIIVDDASTDNTPELLAQLSERPDVRVFRHERNAGKGAALRTGFSHAAGDIVAVQDADLEYDPAELPKLAQPILDDQADAVFGSRYATGSKAGLARANRFLTRLSNMTTGLRLTDMETCYKLMRRHVLQKITIDENRFGIEPEMTAKLARLKIRILEIPISYRPRAKMEGKKIGWRDGVSAVRCILKYGLRRGGGG